MRGLKSTWLLVVVILALAMVAEGQVGLWVSSSTGVSTSGTMAVGGASTLAGPTTVSANQARGLIVTRSAGAAGIQLHSGSPGGTTYAWTSEADGVMRLQHDNDGEPRLELLGASNELGLVASGGITVFSGRVNTNNSQPGFLAYNANADVLPGDTTTVQFDTEVYDTAGNFTASTFTAPVNGTYEFCATVETTNDSGLLQRPQLTLVTTSASYRWSGGNADDNEVTTVSGCVHALMAAAHTASVRVDVGPSGFFVGGGTTPRVTFFSGRLLL